MGMLSEQRLQTSAYGVTQYGQVLLTSSELLGAVDKRLGSDPKRIAKINQKLTAHNGNGLLVYACDSFPFESTDELFYLLVPRTTEWRDYQLSRLRTGDALQRIYAIGSLSKLADNDSLEAISEQLNVTDVRVGYRPVWRSGTASAKVTWQDVQEAAERSLQKMAD